MIKLRENTEVLEFIKSVFYILRRLISLLGRIVLYTIFFMGLFIISFAIIAYEKGHDLNAIMFENLSVNHILILLLPCFVLSIIMYSILIFLFPQKRMCCEISYTQLKSPKEKMIPFEDEK